MVVRLRAVHALCVLPGEVAQEAEERDEQGHGVEDGGGEEARDDGVVFGREAKFGRHCGVDGDEAEPDDHAAGDGEEGVFGPDVGDQRGFAEHRAQHRRVQFCAPDPVAGDSAVALGEVPVPDELGDEIRDEGVIEAVENPGEKGVHLEEDTFLAELVELGVAVEEAGGDELVEDAHDERGKDGEKDVVKGEGPGFKDDLAGKGILKGILLPIVSERSISASGNDMHTQN